MHKINQALGDRRQPSAWTRALLCLGGVALLGGASLTARADEPDAATQAHAEKVAITVCGTCHGPQGNSTYPKYPRLAGQSANYLAAQLKAFRAQGRGDPDAIGYMWGMAAELDDSTIEALASYYARQRPEASARGDATLIARGREVYQHGVESQGVPPCGGCHGADAHGQQDFPRLAGQHGQYLLKQIASFQSNMRNVAIMHGVAQNLRTAEMQAVAAYLEVQP